jgi:hypothetical protein
MVALPLPFRRLAPAIATDNGQTLATNNDVDALIDGRYHDRLMYYFELASVMLTFFPLQSISTTSAS